MQIESQQKDEIVLQTLTISLKRLKKLLREPEIEKLYQTFLQNKQQGNQYVLYLVPFKALPSVIESNLQKFNALLLNKQNVIDFFKSYTLFRFNQFAHIKFTNLTILNLSKQTLYSIQALGFIEAPKLRCLQFHNNKITNLNTLVKADFPKLEIITFYHNPITQIEKLCRIHSKKLTGFEFDSKISYSNRVEDYRFLYKMQNPVPKMIKVQDEKRIDISKRKSFSVLNQPGTKILIHIPRHLPIPPRIIERHRMVMLD